MGRCPQCFACHVPWFHKQIETLGLRRIHMRYYDLLNLLWDIWDIGILGLAWWHLRLTAWFSMMAGEVHGLSEREVWPMLSEDFKGKWGGTWSRWIFQISSDLKQISADFQANFGSWLSHLAMQLYQVPLLEMSTGDWTFWLSKTFDSPADPIRWIDVADMDWWNHQLRWANWAKWAHDNRFHSWTLIWRCPSQVYASDSVPRNLHISDLAQARHFEGWKWLKLQWSHLYHSRSFMPSSPGVQDYGIVWRIIWRMVGFISWSVYVLSTHSTPHIRQLEPLLLSLRLCLAGQKNLQVEQTCHGAQRSSVELNALRSSQVSADLPWCSDDVNDSYIYIYIYSY